MSAATEERTAEGLTAEQWAELGRTIARKMADSWGAEWKPQYWDDVWEARTGKWAELDAHRPQLSALWESGEAGDDERYDLFKDALYEGWRDELVIRLRSKRDSRSIQDVGLSSQDTRIDRPPRHLMLADGKTIAGYLHEVDGKPRFDFRLSHGKEVSLSIPDDAEFAFQRKCSTGPGMRTDRLRLVHESGGYRHYLGRRDVHCGHGITLVLPDGTAIGGRYECNLHREDCEPVFYFSLAGGTQGFDRCLRMPSDAEYLLEGRAL
ncbi:MAG: hypothetical protein QOE70_4340 [Chthoniobacter sp.]|jgi:hypothetical protein|nr:hypothetical protein [Chthoniobacter sp.]